MASEEQPSVSVVSKTLATPTEYDCIQRFHDAIKLDNTSGKSMELGTFLNIMQKFESSGLFTNRKLADIIERRWSGSILHDKDSILNNWSYKFDEKRIGRCIYNLSAFALSKIRGLLDSDDDNDDDRRRLRGDIIGIIEEFVISPISHFNLYRYVMHEWEYKHGSLDIQKKGKGGLFNALKKAQQRIRLYYLSSSSSSSSIIDDYNDD